MNSSEGNEFELGRHIMEENALMLNTIEILDEEKESILSEVLKCYVCLELPAGKQVRICDKGHHFCLSCHKKMEVCGICRGKLLETRNFAVEQLVTKLGAVLGTSGYLQPSAEPPPNLSRGQYKCLHCQRGMPAYQMLQHLRSKHSAYLLENVRSNPYSGRFSFKYMTEFAQDKNCIWSVQVSDMGLFSVELTFSGLDFFGCVRALGDATVSTLFRHQLVVKIPKRGSEFSLEFSVTECPVSSYLDDIESVKREGRGLKIKGENLSEDIDVGSTITIFFSVWKNPQKLEVKKNSSSPSVFCLPESHLYFENDRKIRRNRNRNARRKKLKEKLRISTEDWKQLPERVARIVL